MDIFSAKKRFNLIILSDIIEHIEDDLGFLKKCSEISEFVLLNLPLEKSFSQRKRPYGYDDPSGHLRAYSLNDAFSLIRSANFSIENWHQKCIVDEPVYQKIMIIKRDNYCNVPRSLKKILKTEIKKVIHRIPGFTYRYYGSNLFAFLRSDLRS